MEKYTCKECGHDLPLSAYQKRDDGSRKYTVCKSCYSKKQWQREKKKIEAMTGQRILSRQEYLEKRKANGLYLSRKEEVRKHRRKEIEGVFMPGYGEYMGYF